MKLTIVRIYLAACILVGMVVEHSSAASCTPSDQEVSALMDLYEATNGPSWYRNDNWGVGDPCLWYGVGCFPCQVIELSLIGNKLIGTIPSTIGNLSSLQLLYLDDNELTGTIPSTIGNLSQLGGLELDNNKLTGTIPSTIGNLSQLIFLNLFHNKLTGTIPSTIGNLSSLQILEIYNNQLIGTIPSSIAHLPQLQFLWLQDNMLNGAVPFLTKPNIPFFNISNNQFSCPLPLWCSLPPVGNGLCAPCVNTTANELYCCLYSTNGCLEISATLCSKNSSCPVLPGEQLCGKAKTSDCSKCASAYDALGDSGRTDHVGENSRHFDEEDGHMKKKIERVRRNKTKVIIKN